MRDIAAVWGRGGSPPHSPAMSRGRLRGLRGLPNGPAWTVSSRAVAPFAHWHLVVLREVGF